VIKLTIPVKKLTWSEFVNFTNSLAKEIFIFRGQADIRKRSLSTTLDRKCKNSNEALKFYKKILPDLYKILNTKNLYNKTIKSKFDRNLHFLSYLQHQGFPTLLLDWTKDPLIAAFFALYKNKNNDMAIYCLNKTVFKDFDGNILPSDDKNLYIIKSDKIKDDNDRVLAQKACFTYSTTVDVGYIILSKLREKYKNNNINEYILKIVIPSSERKQIKSYLKGKGITKNKLFCLK
jgi:hypothetical protein